MYIDNCFKNLKKFICPREFLLHWEWEGSSDK